MSVKHIARGIKYVYCPSLRMVDSFILSNSLLFELFEKFQKKFDLCFLVSSDLQNSNIGHSTRAKAPGH